MSKEFRRDGAADKESATATASRDGMSNFVTHSVGFSTHAFSHLPTPSRLRAVKYLGRPSIPLRSSASILSPRFQHGLKTPSVGNATYEARASFICSDIRRHVLPDPLPPSGRRSTPRVNGSPLIRWRRPVRTDGRTVGRPLALTVVYD